MIVNRLKSRSIPEPKIRRVLAVAQHLGKLLGLQKCSVKWLKCSQTCSMITEQKLEKYQLQCGKCKPIAKEEETLSHRIQTQIYSGILRFTHCLSMSDATVIFLMCKVTWVCSFLMFSNFVYRLLLLRGGKPSKKATIL